MFVIVVGGGQVGSHLARILLSAGHEIKVIDPRPAVFTQLRNELPASCLIEADGSSPAVLEAAGIKNAKVLAAVTADDDANLVVTTLARFEFNVPRIIARVNDPRNAWLFNAEMGVDVMLNQADIFSKLIMEEMSLGDMMILLKFRRGQFALVEEKIYPGAAAIGVAIKDLGLPAACTISGIIRKGQMILPRGSTVFQAEDEVLALVDNQSAAELARLLGRPVSL
jgi:trk system potassium uptake protein TrkA